MNIDIKNVTVLTGLTQDQIHLNLSKDAVDKVFGDLNHLHSNASLVLHFPNTTPLAHVLSGLGIPPDMDVELIYCKTGESKTYKASYLMER